jgi:hypothetical protein
VFQRLYKSKSIETSKLVNSYLNIKGGKSYLPVEDVFAPER